MQQCRSAPILLHTRGVDTTTTAIPRSATQPLGGSRPALLRFLGGVGTVTGSEFLVESDHARNPQPGRGRPDGVRRS
ncbi:hypothetical protein FNV62_49760 [Streptomyces sp. RLB3-17]|nr:hypothetical protein FNV61_51185 [Streptomyces sp. RLB3-6]QDO03209.1 hypothetical protein FNV58_51370 [Streptomyces sp. RLB1-9]QDO13550.1 hypothetical protein FNV68_52245 [Streptomyces sp. S1D4-23]QDO24941.1 hypothetical protein FNV65_49955 [Streptomyces sp. S1A1-8]QDO35062.1 hypothetical protein FNV63_49975 [Streptomyces sp. S1A1-3]QDO45078.1 hypothetical protein FNV62_49760 [Streptomyces sp. RLB3-17]